MTDLKKQISASLRKDLEAGELILPSLPEVSMKIQEEVKKQSSTASSIARYIILDPGLTAHLLKVANSPFYRTKNAISELPEAISIIGIDSVLSTALTYTMRTMFVATEGSWKSVLKKQWQESIEMAALIAVSTDYVPGFNKDEVVAAAMLQNVGILPLINHLQHWPQLNEQDIEQLIEENSKKAGLALVKSWGLGKVFEEAILARKNWFHETSSALDTTDLITIARFHYMINQGRLNECPEVTEVPAFRHLEQMNFTPAMSMEWIYQAREKIDHFKNLLTL